MVEKRGRYLCQWFVEIARVPTPQGKHRVFWKFCQNTGKTQGIWFAQVVNFLSPDISVFAMKISVFSEDLDKAVLCM